ncbi:MAG: O-antigen ligase C-terminal domain-containing protein [Burkholderiales bacterium]|nr:O-antigen ligase C-terminal domain-containing protein [Burkholderiales bacterium]
MKPIAERIAAGLLFLLPAAWLIPNHYPPWLSAWSDGWALLTLALVAPWVIKGTAKIDRLWLTLLAVAASSVVLQWATGRIYYRGDAHLVLIYLSAFAVALLCGSSMADDGPSDAKVPPPAYALLSGLAMAAVLSVGVALEQWLAPGTFGLWSVDRPPSSRPFGNVAQPNHLSTLSFIGLVAVALLRQYRMLASGTTWLAAVWLVAGMAASGSRTALLQLGALCVLSFATRRRLLLSPGPSTCVAWGGVYLAFTAAWSSVNRLLFGFDLGRSVEQALQSGGTRPGHWITLTDAALREPWFGYGWTQVSAAQMRAAGDHAPIGEHIAHAHNVVLDLVIWTGIPLGVAMSCALLFWFYRTLRECRDPWGFWSTMAALGVLIHALLEYPHTYAYFLVPVGILCGMSGRRVPLPAVRLSARAARMAVLVYAVIFIPVAIEYPNAEAAFRELRMEAARISPQPQHPVTDPHLVLTQLNQLHRFAASRAQPDMPAADLAWMRQVAGRFGYPGVMLRYATAAGLNGQHAEAEATLRSLCHMHPAPRCAEMRDAWRELTTRYPELRSISVPPEQPS